MKTYSSLRAILVLRHRSGPRSVLSGCSVHFRRAYMNDGEPRPTCVAVIRHLWTRSTHRMQGFAGSLIRETMQ